MNIGPTQIDISCTAGEGPDICVNIHCDKKIVDQFMGNIYPIDFTIEEARKMAAALLYAANNAELFWRFGQEQCGETDEQNDN